MDVDDPAVAQLNTHPPACIIANVCPRGGSVANGTVALEPHPANSNLCWCTSNQHWVHHSKFGDRQTCETCCLNARTRNACNHENHNVQQSNIQLEMLNNQPPPPAINCANCPKCKPK
jgi:hypothetical protein